MALAAADLESPYYLVREKAKELLDLKKTVSVSYLAEKYLSFSPLAKIEVLAFLQSRIWGTDFNELAWKELSSPNPELRREAIRFLAGHPDTKDPNYLEWSRDIVMGDSLPDLRAYLTGIRKPAPDFQCELILSLDSRIPWTRNGSPVLSALGAGSRAAADRAYRKVCEQIGRGLAPPNLLLEALRHLAKNAMPDSLPMLMELLASASPDLRNEASKAIEQILAHLFRARRFDELLLVRTRMSACFPQNIDYGLDLADALIQYGPDPGAAEALLLDLRKRILAFGDTHSLVQDREISLGLALAAFWKGEDWRRHLADIEENPDAESHEGEALRRVMARDRLLAGGLELAGGSKGSDSFLSALKIAPYHSDHAEIDLLFGGRFSLAGLIGKLNRLGREDDSERIFRVLVTALEEDPSGSGYYPLPKERTLYADRVRSSIPLEEARFLFHEAALSEMAAIRLEDFLLRLEGAEGVRGDLEGRAGYLLGLCRLEQGDCPGAESAVARGIKSYEEILAGYEDLWRDQALREDEEYCRREKSRGYLFLEIIGACAEEPSAESEKAAWKAYRTAPEFEEALITLALVLARKGSAEPARALLAALFPYPDRAYRLACLHALIGDSSSALESLDRYLDDYMPPRKRSLAAAFAARDPDLASIRAQPAFEKIIGGR